MGVYLAGLSWEPTCKSPTPLAIIDVVHLALRARVLSVLQVFVDVITHSFRLPRFARTLFGTHKTPERAATHKTAAVAAEAAAAPCSSSIALAFQPRAAMVLPPRRSCSTHTHRERGSAHALAGNYSQITTNDVWFGVGYCCDLFFFKTWTDRRLIVLNFLLQNFYIRILLYKSGVYMSPFVRVKLYWSIVQSNTERVEQKTKQMC